MTIAATVRQTWPRLVSALLLVASFATSTVAHEIQPTVIDLGIGQERQLSLTLKLNLEALIAGIGAEHTDTDESIKATEYNRLRLLPPARLEVELQRFLPRLIAGSRLDADGGQVALRFVRAIIPEVGDSSLARASRIELGGRLPAGQTNLVWRWDAGFGANVLRVDSDAGEEIYTAYLQAGQASDPIPLTGPTAQPGTSLFFDYLGLGFDHILPKGIDHILFVIGLFLLNARFSALLWQVSGFTLAHTLTLALGIYGVVQLPPSIVEPLIAASIIYVCVENLFYDRLTRWRPMVVFLFGLLHGLGFAGVLREIGLPTEAFVTGLIAFNIGVELGQLVVIAGCYLAVGLWFSHERWYRQLITLPASLLIALVGGYWLVERITIG